MMMPFLSPHFSFEEMTHSEIASRRGIPNELPPELSPNLTRVANFLEKVRLRLGQPVIVHSGYRSPAVNKAVGGVPTSAHCQALAADIVMPAYGGPHEVACAICVPDLLTDLDQIILEYGWVHLGLAELGELPRRQLLTKRSAAAPYERGLMA